MIRLSSTSAEAVKSDIQKLLPSWNGEVGYMGGGISVIKLPPQVLTPAEIDESGEVLTPAVIGDTERYDINIHPKYEDEYTAIEFETLVEPESPDHKIYKKL